MPIRSPSDGQASVELVALLPLIALVALVVLQGALAGGAYWLTGSAAREAARAQALGRDPLRAARATLPGGLAATARVTGGEDAVRVRVRVPSLLGVDLGTVAASAHLEVQR